MAILLDLYALTNRNHMCIIKWNLKRREHLKDAFITSNGEAERTNTTFRRENMLTRDGIKKFVKEVFPGDDLPAARDHGMEPMESMAAMQDDAATPDGREPEDEIGTLDADVNGVVENLVVMADGDESPESYGGGVLKGIEHKSDRYSYWANTLLGSDIPEAQNAEEPSFEAEPAQVEEMHTTTISKDTRIIGDIDSNGHVEVYGNLTGNIKATGNVLICGEVNGDIAGNNAELISCSVNGNIHATEAIKINAESVVIGNVLANDMVLDGKLKGDVKISETVFFKDNAVLLGKVEAVSISIREGARLFGEIQIEHGNDEKLFSRN